MNALARRIGMRGLVLTCALAVAAPFALTACDPPGTCSATHNAWVKVGAHFVPGGVTGSEAFARNGWWSDGSGGSCQGIRVRDPWVRDTWCYSNIAVWGSGTAACWPDEQENVGNAALIMTKSGHFYNITSIMTADYNMYGEEVVYYDGPTVYNSCWWDGSTPGGADLACDHHHDY
jgi:hypothetical protein